MDRHTRSYSLIRTLILGSAALAIVGVLFAIYQSMSGGPTVRPSRFETAQAPLPELPGRADGGADTVGKGVQIGGDVHLPGGGQGSLSLYDRGSDRPTAVISHRGWEPIEGSDNQFHVTEPRIKMRTPNGQLVELQAHLGLIQLRMDEGDRPTLRHGRLTGDVEIRIDRFDDEQRAALPEDERNNPGPDRLVIVNLDDVDFDREFARLTTTGRFSVESAEASIEGRGLTLRYNELNSSVEHLETVAGGRIVVRGLGRMFKVGLPGVEDADEALGASEPPQELAEAPTAEAEPLPSPPQTPSDDMPVVALDERRADKAHPTIRYRAAFTGDVQVCEVKGGATTGELVADVLEVLFAFGQAERDAASARTVTPAVEDAEPTDAETEPGEPGEPGVLTVTWSGPLVVKTVHDEPGAADADRPDAADGLLVVATGDQVRVTQGDRSVRCRKLVYDQGAERHQLYGSPDQPAVIEAGGGFLEGPEIELDLHRQTARITGPGRMSDTGRQRARLGLESAEIGPRPGVDIRFADEVNVTFGTATVETTSPDTGLPVTEQRRHLKTAVFLGSVSMKQGNDLIAGDRVELEFDVPRPGGAFEDSMRRLQAEGNVVLIHGDEAVRCQRIDVELRPDRQGRVTAKVARAYDNVSATQGDRTITAGDQMLVVLGSFRVEKEPWDLGKAWVEAIRRGVNPEEVDWAEQRTKYESRDDFRPGVVRLDACGGVKVDDPEQNLRVTADLLECSFSDGRRIDQALVTGSDASPAHVELDDYAITARVVELDVARESADVPGRGRLVFNSLRDLDGRTLDEPIPVAVTWSRRMTYRGVNNQAVITGNVEARTEQSSFDCGELTIHFADSPSRSASAEAPGGADGGKIDWWIFAPLVDRVAGALGERPGDRIIEDDFDKEPVYLAATGGTVALTSKVEPGTGRILSRGRIAGPTIFVDLRTQAMTVENAGTLLIEDYHLPVRSGKPTVAEADRRTPFGGLGVSSPSQTFLRWEGEMSYYFGKQAAFFERGVEMAHRSGTEIILGREMVGQATYDAVIESGPSQGRSASLTCDKLAVQFHRPEDQDARDNGGAGDMSGYELSLFEATGRVHFQDAGITVLARRVTYNALRNWLTIHGGQGQPATLYDQRNGYREWKAEVIDWNRQTGEIHAPKASVLGR